MNKITGNEPAMPSAICCNENGIFSSEDCNSAYKGLTIRQQFAMAAMSARIIADAILSAHVDSPIAPSETLAKLADMDDDALINELNKSAI